MKSIKIGSICLFLAVILIVIFISGKKINTTIEETIKENYQSEISVLKDKLNKQSELINSIININNKNEQTSNTNSNTSNTITQNNTNNNTNNSSSTSNNVNTQEFEYIIENGSVTITKYLGNKTSIQIPNNIEGLPVQKIGENAFSNTKVKNVTLPSGCLEIDWFAFYGCYALTTVYISSNVNTIGYGAFDSCSKSLTIYCEKNSYAQKYAQSFGISYSYIQ